MGISTPGVQTIERNEKEGRITVKSLEEAAAALDMQLHYVLLPREGTLEDILERQAYKKAKEIVSRTHQTMALEDQASQADVVQAETNTLAEDLMREMPRYLWD